tara:strand:- start:147 stop:557 length:411 start_codon:yes stop_codon:yes gene_type:complete
METDYKQLAKAVYCEDTVLDALKGGKDNDSWDWGIVVTPAGLVADLAAPCLVICPLDCNWTLPKNTADIDSDYPRVPDHGYVFVFSDDCGKTDLYHNGSLIMSCLNSRGAWTIDCFNKHGKLVYHWEGDDTKWENR